jgi:Resolvase, N terminal domain
MNRAVAYCRTACGTPSDRLSGLEDQRNAIRQYATRNGLTVVDTYMDVGVSGASLNRPQLQQLIADCRAGNVRMVVTQDPDRLSRDYSQLLALLQMFKAEGVCLAFATQEGRNQLPCSSQSCGRSPQVFIDRARETRPSGVLASSRRTRVLHSSVLPPASRAHATWAPCQILSRFR